MTKAEYWNEIRRLMSEAPPGGHNPCEHMVAYFDGHLPRFEWQWDAIQAHVPKLTSVFDLGTKFPFISYWPHLRDDARLTYGSPDQAWRGLSQLGVIYRPINLCRERWPEQADLVIATEVLEHLPCNVWDAWKRVRDMARAYLLVSFPLHGDRADGYEMDYGDWDREHHEHVREFTETTAGAFLTAASEFEIIAEAAMPTPAYRAPIRNVLLRRTA